jgi:hypothetical protein
MSFDAMSVLRSCLFDRGFSEGRDSLCEGRFRPSFFFWF